MIGAFDPSTLDAILGGAGNPRGSLAPIGTSGAMQFTDASSGSLLSAVGTAQGGAAAPLKVIPVQTSAIRSLIADLNKQTADAAAANKIASSGPVVAPTQAGLLGELGLTPTKVVVIGAASLGLWLLTHKRKKGKA